MKKLKLNLQQIEGAALLTRAQLKRVLGGDVSVTKPPSGLCGDHPDTPACCCATKEVGTCESLLDKGCHWIGGEDCITGCPSVS